jgi:CPA1 family monovalent cation:H+ antiporter
VALAERLIGDYERQMHRHSANASRRVDLDTLAAAERRLRLAALRAERAELSEMHEADVINDETMRVIEAEIDHAESFVAPTPSRGHG